MNKEGLPNPAGPLFAKTRSPKGLQPVTIFHSLLLAFLWLTCYIHRSAKRRPKQTKEDDALRKRTRTVSENGLHSGKTAQGMVHHDLKSFLIFL
ncbi:MAG: hypothetical protein LUG58_02295 [Clostridiales bacterium]|nr:hypothetical protein [Clostridiales bacterium]